MLWPNRKHFMPSGRSPPARSTDKRRSERYWTKFRTCPRLPSLYPCPRWSGTQTLMPFSSIRPIKDLHTVGSR
jgi:hypothetical protein